MESHRLGREPQPHSLRGQEGAVGTCLLAGLISFLLQGKKKKDEMCQRVLGPFVSHAARVSTCRGTSPW